MCWKTYTTRALPRLQPNVRLVSLRYSDFAVCLQALEYPDFDRSWFARIEHINLPRILMIDDRCCDLERDHLQDLQEYEADNE